MKTLLFNPFEKYSERILIIVGLAFTVIGGYLGFVFNARFDGVIDLHFVEKVSLYQPILEIGINILCTTVLLFIVGKIINPKTRIIDIFLTSMIARIPYYIVTFFNANNKAYTISQGILNLVKSNKTNPLSSTDIFYLLLMSFAIIASLIWFIALLFNGFKTAVNAKETKHILLFIAAIVAAEIISKIVIINFL
ncbi:hypothetical protein [Flavobacterium sp. AED]|uniref:hypothetical protein n=1 Tax=Flavobacterium sp. AED TaxID=1423323 RepID=UPI00057EA6EA|nr:hypothetical protein [Flavobacterium sp. AED]KIA87532.1 hypothetical protein OA85_08135 [Flavobacterium sp. AED]